LTDVVDFHLGQALELLAAFEQEGRQFELAFVDAAKKEYIDYVRNLLIQLQQRGEARQDADPTAATFFLLGALNWIYQWYKVDGRLTEDQLAQELTELFGKGFVE